MSHIGYYFHFFSRKETRKEIRKHIRHSAGLEFDPMVCQSSYGILAEIDPFGTPDFYGIVTYFRWLGGDIPHGMLTYKYWPMTPFMDFSFMSFAHSQQGIVK